MFLVNVIGYSLEGLMLTINVILDPVIVPLPKFQGDLGFFFPPTKGDLIHLGTLTFRVDNEPFSHYFGVGESDSSGVSIAATLLNVREAPVAASTRTLLESLGLREVPQLCSKG